MFRSNTSRQVERCLGATGSCFFRNANFLERENRFGPLLYFGYGGFWILETGSPVQQ